MGKLSESLVRVGKFLRPRLVLGVVILVVAATVIISYGFLKRGSASGEYITRAITKGTIEMNVIATGTVNAVTTVQVGSQVSGTIESLNGTDFNSIVKRGQVIARLDQSIFLPQLKRAQADVQAAEASVQTATANLSNQKANLASVRANLEALRVAMEDAGRVLRRNKELMANGVISDRDLEAAQAGFEGAVARHNEAKSKVGQAEAQVKSAEANVEQTRAQVTQSRAALALAQANLDHTIITSPVDGVVISRNVDVGQTVAASLQAPTLFTIANDLTQTQVIGKVDEADVGKIGVGGSARFTVDAFPEDSFTGRISQIRLNAQTQQNVVVYDVVIDVQNPQLKLRPGMTANITLPVARRENALTLPNAALRFRPQLPEAEMAKIMEEMQAKWQANRSAETSTDPTAGDRLVADGNSSKGGSKEDARQPGPDRRMQGRSPGAGDGPAVDAGSRAGDGGPKWNREGGGRPGGWQGGPGSMGGRRFTPEGREGPKRDDRSAARPAPKSSGSGAVLEIQPPESSASRRSRPQIVWVMGSDKKPEPRWVRTGITDGRSSEIVDGDLNEGDVIILGQNLDSSQIPAQQRTPFGGQPRGPGGGGGGGMPRRF